jgi:hypothetical protein
MPIGRLNSQLPVDPIFSNFGKSAHRFLNLRKILLVNHCQVALGYTIQARRADPTAKAQPAARPPAARI